MDAKAQIRVFVGEVLAQKGETREIGDDDSLVTAGLLDSLDIVATVAFLEERFGVDFASHPFHADEFDTITSIAAIVAERAARR
jgi:acyl carrier protein